MRLQTRFCWLACVSKAIAYPGPVEIPDRIPTPIRSKAGTVVTM